MLYESEQAIAFERALSDSLMKINDELKARIAEYLMVSMYSPANVQHLMQRNRELWAENQRLRGGIANAMLCDSVVQMHECLTALLGGGE